MTPTFIDTTTVQTSSVQTGPCSINKVTMSKWMVEPAKRYTDWIRARQTLSSRVAQEKTLQKYSNTENVYHLLSIPSTFFILLFDIMP